MQPTNAYELCERTIELIETHKRQFNMCDFMLVDGAWTPNVKPDLNNCRTTYCRGGFMCLAADPRDPRVNGDHAESLLGLTYQDRKDGGDGGFYFDVYNLFYSWVGDAQEIDADWGIQGIRDFMAKWEGRLKRTPIPSAGTLASRG